MPGLPGRNQKCSELGTSVQSIQTSKSTTFHFKINDTDQLQCRSSFLHLPVQARLAYSVFGFHTSILDADVKDGEDHAK